MSWMQTTLGSIYDVRDGTHDSPKYVDSGFPLVTSKNLKNGQINLENTKLISKEDFININKRSGVDVGDVLMAMIGTIGNPIIIQEKPEFAIKNVALFKVSSNQSGQFLKYYLESNFVKSKMFKEAKGTTQKFVGLGYLRDFPISLPPTEEQKRIVAILDSAFEQIDQAKAIAQQNLQNAREIFDSALNLTFNSFDNNWKKLNLASLAKFIDYRGRTPVKTESGLRLITAKNIRMGFVKKEPCEFVAPETYDDWMTRGIPQKGDVLFTTEAPLANVAQLDTEEKVVFAQRVIVLQHHRDVIDGTFLKFALMSSPIQKNIHDKGTGATATGIKASLLKQVMIPFPIINEQKQIADKLVRIKKQVESLESIYQQKIAALDELKQSLLQQAFSGKLTANHSGAPV
jgi:type I restriction enzyme S subunit